ncbi:MAG TPA: methylated-DNA--[protein]-cysteine S-methyltransferase [Holophagaceae bacterium]|jgi:AraC family transcriptional regulator of adaptative response/methylated-DNA-[protein]-cysteine methyltransferase|nr:methylated-DNA--[protein]-cysteine S-methyltransferase [Holophagaceae bacterium]
MARSDYTKVEQAIQFIGSRVQEQPGLAEVAEEVGLSEFHFQRLFQRWAGVSPKRFLQFLTLEEAKKALADSRSVLEASYAAGLSGPGRLHDLFISLERMTPGEYKAQAAGLRIHWGVEDTPFGPALFAALDRGLCGLSFLLDDGPEGAFEELRARWPGAKLEASPTYIRPYAQSFNARVEGRTREPLSLVLKGTPFQLKTWEALLRIPEGRVAAYQDLAKLAGEPGAIRAAASAVGRNPIACLIPCHRVIQSTGAFGQYHWGSPRKQAMLAFERARVTGAAVGA